jgi:hypothetical protein
VLVTADLEGYGLIESDHAEGESWGHQAERMRGLLPMKRLGCSVKPRRKMGLILAYCF